MVRSLVVDLGGCDSIHGCCDPICPSLSVSTSASSEALGIDGAQEHYLFGRRTGGSE